MDGQAIPASWPIRDRLKNAWNAFNNKDPSTGTAPGNLGPTTTAIVTSTRPYKRRQVYYGDDQTIATAIYNRIATDAASAIIHHCQVDDVGGFVKEIDSGLNECLTINANIDQTGRAFVQDLVQSMLDEGVIAAVPIDTSIDPLDTSSFDIETMRVGRITTWYPDRVEMDIYNDRRGTNELLTMPKSKIAIVENPFYAIMNEPNSVLKRLVHKMALLDVIDDQSGSGKLDLLLQLPYTVRSEARQTQAEERKKKIEDQLENSKYGIAYIDGTEKVIQLNRPVDNNLLAQIEYLTSMLYSQLGITQDILNGTAGEETMMNYYKRTVDVVLNAIVDEFTRKFLTKTARTQNQRIKYYRDPFSLTPTSAIADIADKFTRNEVLSPNEVRGIVGFNPSTDPKADELRNRNINLSVEDRNAMGYESEYGDYYVE